MSHQKVPISYGYDPSYPRSCGSIGREIASLGVRGGVRGGVRRGRLAKELGFFRATDLLPGETGYFGPLPFMPWRFWVRVAVIAAVVQGLVLTVLAAAAVL